ncbi:MAG: flagellar filament outer layer protein FlaA [Spirochaetales bacterium]|nr:flagellar filament outer layer protein FlaA [Spirochaetales bacterium]
MKRFIVVLLVLTLMTSAVFAKEDILIDFSMLTADDTGQNPATIMDYGSEAGTRYSEDEKSKMVSSLYIENWEVELTSSSRTVLNDRLSYVKEVSVPEGAINFPGETVIGIRIHYPEQSFNSYGFVKPPFEIPAYATHPGDEEASVGNQFNGYGVLKNVGVIKSVSINVKGMNFDQGIAVVLRDEQEGRINVPFGYLNFEGWKELVWENPNYITEVRNREMRRSALYPTMAPSITFESIDFYKDAMMDGGDFIAYVKDISVAYDLAVLENVDEEIDDEAVWGILADREEERRKNEIKRLGNLQVLRYIEQQKMHVDGDGVTTSGDATTAE